MADKFANILKFCTPSEWWGEKWREGLFLGNGKTSANVYGGASEERLLINEQALNWMGRTNVVPDISMKLRDVRKKIDGGDFLGAQSVLPTALEQKNFRSQAEYPLPLCKLDLHFQLNDTPTNFCRVLDMEHGEATVTYNIGNTKYIRQVFVSRADNVVAYRITKQGAGNINVDLSFTLMHRVNARTYEGTCNMPEGEAVKCEKQFLYFAARNDDNGTDYGAVAKVTTLGGSVRSENSEMIISNAQSVFIVIKTFVEGSREREWNSLRSQLDANKDGYDKLFKAHAALHSKLYLSADISLAPSADAYIEDLLLETDGGDIPPLLVEKIYKFSRYLMVAGTTDDGNMMSPCGLWNGCYKPYRAFKCASGELEMTYLHAFCGNLFADLDKTFDYFERNMGDYRNNAQRLFGCRGILVPVVAAPNTGRLGSSDTFAVHFTGCGAWLANFYYKYATYSQNTKFLKSRLIPFMKEVATFYEDFFVKTSQGLEISPSALPMRIADSYKITDRPVIAKNSELDFALARDMLTNLIEACQLCGVKQDASWNEMLKGMPQTQVASDGVIKEFVNSIISVDYTGISNGTLYPAYFGNSVSWMSDPETVQTYLTTADKKRSVPSSQNSYNMTVLGAVYARLGDAFKAKLCLTNTVRGCAMNNLVFVDKDWRGMGICGSGVWTPVQLHANMVFANDVQQMLMYSHKNVLKIFPALPSDWTSVRFENFVAENGVYVKAQLDAAKGVFNLHLESKKEVKVDLYLPDNVKKLLKTNMPVKPDGKHFAVTVPANKSVEFQYKYVVR